MRLRAYAPVRLCACAPTRLRACAPVRLRACAPVRLRAYAPVRLCACAPTRLRACAPARLRACAPVRLRAYAPTRVTLPKRTSQVNVIHCNTLQSVIYCITLVTLDRNIITRNGVLSSQYYDKQGFIVTILRETGLYRHNITINKVLS